MTDRERFVAIANHLCEAMELANLAGDDRHAKTVCGAHSDMRAALSALCEDYLGSTEAVEEHFRNGETDWSKAYDDAIRLRELDTLALAGQLAPYVEEVFELAFRAEDCDEPLDMIDFMCANAGVEGFSPFDCSGSDVREIAAELDRQRGLILGTDRPVV